MDFVFTFALVSLVILIACIIAYRYYTNSIIKDQEKQIARQRTEIFRLQAEINKLHANADKEEPASQIIRIYDSRIDPENIPNYNDI